MKTTFQSLFAMALTCPLIFYAFGSGRIIKSSVLNNYGEPLPIANVLLLISSDSTLVKGDVTNLEGGYSFEGISPRKYIISTSMIGYTYSYSEPFTL